MPTPPLPSVPPPQARWRRPLLWGLGGLLVLELLYNAVLVTGLLATVINHFSRDHPRVEWSRAWSLVPGHVHVRDLKLGQEAANGSSWQLELGEVKVELSLLALLKRELKADSLDVRGLQLRIRSGTPEPGGDTPRKPPPADPWKVLLHGVRVQNVRELDVKGVRLTGITDASGSLEVVPGHRVSVRDAKVRLGPGQLSYEEEAMLHLEQGSGEFSLETQRQGPESGLDLITGLTGGRFQFTATHPALSELPRLTSGLEGVSLRGGSGKLEVDLHVKEGRLAQGTQLKGSAEPLLVSTGSLRLKAPWRFHSDVYTHEDGTDRLGLKLTLGPARMESGEGPTLETSEVILLLGAKAPRLDQSPPDIQLELHTKPLHVTWGGATMKGLVHVEVDARKLAYQGGKVVLHGSRVQLQEVSVQAGQDEAHNWEGMLTFPEATLALSPPAAEGRFSGSFSNAAPFVALLTAQGALPRVLSPLLNANNLGLTGTVSLGEKGAKVSKLLANGQGLELRGTAESTGGSPHVVLLVKMGILSVGVETGSGATHVQVLNASSWYQEKTGAPTE
ncbi:hypothetical protein [Hyalangium sp.]|uniref:hypothetical protein n=1 Tax=Hyalangium sp. TaxID=2028555 RepID=UPI002D669620|nr:hypothetical protein [Hyalangium sp.]HYH98892.1 hypothetical protein [Hyalangium sp.]